MAIKLISAAQTTKDFLEDKQYTPEEITAMEGDYDDIMTLSNFVDSVNLGCFTDNDGYGHGYINGKDTEIMISPSDFKKDGKYVDNPEGFTHINWFNK